MNTRRALVCAPVMSEFDRESGSRRIFDLLMFLRESGWAVTFVPQRAPDGERYRRILQQRGIATFVGFDQLTDRIISTGHYDLALFEFWEIAEQHLPYIRRTSPSTRVIVDSIDLHFLRHARRTFLNAGGNSGACLLDQNYGMETVRELNTYAAADCVLAVSQKEADLINDLLCDPALASRLPDCEELEPSPLGFAEREGILFLGNFRHTPNVDAVEYLCRQILPQIDPALLKKHPVSFVGTGLNDKIRGFAENLPHVRMIGWVPSVLPYLQRARMSVIPLLYGAGTKRKVVQSLMVGTPTVSTSIGVEGLGLRDREHVLVADNAKAFARAMMQLLHEDRLWSSLARKGRAHILPLHGRALAKQSFLERIEATLVKRPKTARLTSPTKDHDYRVSLHYRGLAPCVREAASASVPEGAKVAVISKGDEELVRLHGRTGWHFPQSAAGLYAGHHPANSGAAIEHLEQLRGKGAEFLIIPSTAFWWLDYYREFGDYVLSIYLQVAKNENCRIFDLRSRMKEGARNETPLPKITTIG